MKIRALLNGVAKAMLGQGGTKEAPVEKRLGTYVSRPVLNAAEWHAWGVKHGIPGLVPAEEMHVTIVHSTVDVKMPCDTCPTMIYTMGWNAGAFVTMGPDDQALVFAFRDWSLADRHWAYVDNGAVSTWPTFRPHLTLTMAVGDYEIPDEALQDVPDLIILGGEVVGPIKTPDPAEEDAGVEDDDVDDGDMIVVVVIEAAVKAAAEKALAAPHGSIFDEMGLRDIAKGRPVTKAVLKSIASRNWAPEEIKKAAGAEVAPPPAAERVVIKGKTYERREVTMTVGKLPEAIAKAVKDVAKFQPDEEQRLVWGWASVATVKGVPVEDFEGDTITTGAQREWLHSLMKGQRAGSFEHGREDGGDVVVVSEVVEGIVLDADVQKALGIDLGMEGVLTCTHVTDDSTWDLAKSGDWMHSIAGTMLVLVEE